MKNSKKNTGTHVINVNFYSTTYGNNYKHCEAREYWHNAEIASDNPDRNWNDLHNFDNRQRNETPRGLTYYISGLILTAQSHYDDTTRRYTEFYARETKATEPASMKDIEESIATVKRLQTLEKKYSQMVQDFGRPATMSDYINYIAKCLDAQITMYDEDTKTFRAVDIDTLRYRESKCLNPNS